AAVTKPGEYQGWWADTLFGKKGESSLRDSLEWAGKTIGARAAEGTIGPDLQPGTSAPVLPPELAGPSRLLPSEAKKSLQDKFNSFGAGGSAPQGFMSQKLT